MARPHDPARIAKIVGLCTVRRHVAQAAALATRDALEQAEAAQQASADHRDASLVTWTEVLAGPVATPAMFALAGEQVVQREHHLVEARRTAQGARDRSDTAVMVLAEANARHEIARTLRTRADRERGKQMDNRMAAEAEDRLLHRWRP
jgi:hypothetical protein